MTHSLIGADRTTHFKIVAVALVSAIVGLIEGHPVESTLITPRLVVRDSCGGQRNKAAAAAIR